MEDMWKECNAHAVRMYPCVHHYDWETTKQIIVVEKEKSELSSYEYKEEKLIRANRWIVKWGVGFTLVIAVIWPILTLPAACRAIQQGILHILGSDSHCLGHSSFCCHHSLPMIESWETIRDVLLGMFTNDRLMEKMEEINLKLQTIMSP
ncbi:hypothetical protein C2S51_017662 [Perilla frutescens var. frutescens]|nr:hypothetical protein C2S51_017662 [Perilla frutescens var. frutescens]